MLGRGEIPVVGERGYSRLMMVRRVVVNDGNTKEEEGEWGLGGRSVRGRVLTTVAGLVPISMVRTVTEERAVIKRAGASVWTAWSRVVGMGTGTGTLSEGPSSDSRGI